MKPSPRREKSRSIREASPTGYKQHLSQGQASSTSTCVPNRTLLKKLQNITTVCAVQRGNVIDRFFRLYPAISWWKINSPVVVVHIAWIIHAAFYARLANGAQTCDTAYSSQPALSLSRWFAAITVMSRITSYWCWPLLGAAEIKAMLHMILQLSFHCVK